MAVVALLVAVAVTSPRTRNLPRLSRSARLAREVPVAALAVPATPVVTAVEATAVETAGRGSLRMSTEVLPSSAAKPMASW